MKEFYDPSEVESRVQEQWDTADAFRVTEDPDREKFYCLTMFPYPSGSLHMGHVRNYTIGDVIARYHRMRGKNVLQPIGWDAFGMPAENAAIERDIPPARWTYANIDDMRGQFKQLGFAYDWSREFATCDPNYYRWEQWFFTKMMEKGLAYKKKGAVNWDPVDQTVLANEQVIDGKGWRSGATVERREIEQWFLKITDYAEELLENLETMDGWPDAVRTMQRNWIGRSEGLEIDFPVGGETIRVFTTRPDTLFGVTFMALAPDHPLSLKEAERNPKLEAFIGECRSVGTAEAELATLEKKGVPTSIQAIHPITGDVIPVWVANFIVMEYGSGAVMGVPAHDQRDWEFARAHDIPTPRVIEPLEGEPGDLEKGADVIYGRLVNSGEYTGLTSEEAFDALAIHFEKEGTGCRKVNYRLRDWGVSRQRYWGCPVPAVHTADGQTVPASELPVVLPEDVTFKGVKSPIKEMPSFYETTVDGEPARRETDTFDTFVESSWYYARFACPDSNDAMLDERANYWLPVDQYIGGIEHAILHLLYARFWHKAMRDEGLVQSDEPFTNLLCQGMVHGDTYGRDPGDGKIEYYNADEVEVQRGAKGRVIGATLKADGKPVEYLGMLKMSKSKRNGIDPQPYLDRYGADTVRLFMMSKSPPELSLEFSDADVEGAFRFMKAFWKRVAAHVSEGAVPALDVAALDERQRALRRKLHETIEGVSDDVGRRYKFNTAIAKLRALINAMDDFDDRSDQGRSVLDECWDAIVRMLAPIAPHCCQALWEGLGHDTLLMNEAWPDPDPAAMVRDTVGMVVQVNGKLRGRIRVSTEAEQKDVEAAALADPNVRRFVEGKQVRKVIVVPGKIVNIVVT